MVRPYLEKPLHDMEKFIMLRVHPKVMDRTVVSRGFLDDIIEEQRAPASFRSLTYYEKNTVLCAALRNVGWEKYSKAWSRRVNAWIVPEVAAHVP